VSKPFKLIHSDLKSFLVESYHRYKYVIVFYDDYSSHAWILCLRQKSSAISTTKQFIAMVNTYYESAVRLWMSDAGGEYKSDVFDNMLRNQGIKILTSTLHTPQQNRRAERFMRTFMDKAEAMRFTACIPQFWWEFSIEYAVQLYNRTPQECLKWSTPFVMLVDGEKPHVDQFRVFGCRAGVLIPQKTRANKLAPKSKLMTYIR
jgi:transposase InsO family protein